MKKSIQRAVNLIVLFAICLVITVGSCACAFTATPAGATSWQSGELKIHFIDVGQGDCAIVELPDGKKMMIDGGNGEESHNRKIIAALNELRITKIDYLIATHADVDHVGGLALVVDRVEVVNVYLPYQPRLNVSGAYFDFYDKVSKEAVNVNYSKRYIHECGNDYFFTFLYPYSLASENVEDDNGSSAVVWLESRGVSVLFTGDMPSDSEEQIAFEYELEPTIFDRDGHSIRLETLDILKVAHHGSEYSSSLDWLRLIAPRTAVISCGKNNRYDHPSQGVMENLREASPDIEIYRTDECGKVIITSATTDSYTVNYENQGANAA